ncbi:chloride channel protein [Stigmatella sp. ncwal1]|uniref:Chloride channel protein n=1 Tax=Stigmatella ashevillensis TaxID=2995309 RepID=A0ABT5DLP1_9BACT|nr:chloride channel protein [Stigmatella ashevillena]MDC0713282.1 chloride channel protein [Stigmatella ashevillena]
MSLSAVSVCLGSLIVGGCGPMGAEEMELAQPLSQESNGLATRDAGTQVDAGLPIDAGPQVDAGTPIDAGTQVDAGLPIDAGIDAGTPIDAGIDAGTPIDAGIDAGTPIDAGIDAGVLCEVITSEWVEAEEAAGAPEGTSYVEPPPEEACITLADAQ